MNSGIDPLSKRGFYKESMLNWEGTRSYQLPHLTPLDLALYHITLLICFTPGPVKGNPEGNSEKMLKLTSLGNLLKPWIGMGILDPGQWLGRRQQIPHWAHLECFIKNGSENFSLSVGLIGVELERSRNWQVVEQLACRWFIQPHKWSNHSKSTSLLLSKQQNKSDLLIKTLDFTICTVEG